MESILHFNPLFLKFLEGVTQLEEMQKRVWVITSIMSDLKKKKPLPIIAKEKGREASVIILAASHKPDLVLDATSCAPHHYIMALGCLGG